MTVKQNLPKGWQLVKLDDICESKIANHDPKREPNTAFIYVDITSIDASTKTITEPKKLLGKDAPSRARQVLQAGDVIVSTTRPNLNAVAKITEDFDKQICSTGFCVLRPNQNQLDSSYLFHFVKTKNFVQSLSDLVKGALYPAVTDKDVRAQLIPLPPLDEQKRIAKRLNEQLSAVESARKAAEEQLQAAWELPSAYLRETFSNPNWDWIKLGELCEINPRRPSIERSDGKLTTFVPMASVDNLLGFIREPIQKKFAEVKKGYTYFIENDVIFAKITPCMENGKHAIARNLIDGFGFGSTEFHVIRPNEKIISEWIWYFVRQPSVLQDATNYFAGAVGQQRVPDAFLKSLEIPLPEISEQREIVSALNEKMKYIEMARRSIESQLEEINALPSALLGRAFAGGV